jgi:hypothetical protein
MSSELIVSGVKDSETGLDLTIKSRDSAQDLLKPDSTLLTTVDRSTMDGKSKIVRGLGTADKQIQDLLNMDFQVNDILCHDVSLVEPTTGEVTESVRMVFFLGDDTTMSCCSKGIYRSLKIIIANYGLPSPTSPYYLKIKTITTRQGRTTYNLITLPAPTAPEVARKAGK